MPMHSSNFARLGRLEHLTLGGIRFLTSTLSGLAALRTVTIMNLDCTSSDYSFHAHQVALHCRHLERLDIGGYPALHGVYYNGQHSSSSVLLLDQLHRALERRVPDDWRLWLGVPLVIEEFRDPVRIPNILRQPVTVGLRPPR